MKAKDHPCYKCSYLVTAGELTMCGYFEKTGKLRSWPDGKNGKMRKFSWTEPCPEKIYDARATSRVPPFPEWMKKKEEPKPDKRKGLRCSWDWETAKQLYAEGVPIKEIAERVGGKPAVIYNYATRYEWRRGPRKKKCKGETNNGNSTEQQSDADRTEQGD